jgi:hypothetical protein
MSNDFGNHVPHDDYLRAVQSNRIPAGAANPNSPAANDWLGV